MSLFTIPSGVSRSLALLTGYSPFLELHANPVSTGLNDYRVIFHRTDGPYNAADRDDHIAHRQFRAHLFRLLFPLVLRADEQKIENSDHHYQHNHCHQILIQRNPSKE